MSHYVRLVLRRQLDEASRPLKNFNIPGADLSRSGISRHYSKTDELRRRVSERNMKL